jgi:hypothetical protein
MDSFITCLIHSSESSIYLIEGKYTIVIPLIVYRSAIRDINNGRPFDLKYEIRTEHTLYETAINR